MIPLPLNGKAVAAAVLVISLIASHLIAWQRGANHVRAQWETERSQAVAQAAEVKVAQAQVTASVVTQYIDRVRVVRQKGDTIIKEVPTYVPTTACPLPGGFRLLHDAAARGDDPGPAGGLDAPAVPAQDLARTVIDNYTGCRDNAEQLSALQAWVAGVSATGGQP